MKYIDAEKLKETIKYHIRCFEKELQSFSDEDYVCSTAAQYAAEKATLENIQNIIDSLQQEQLPGIEENGIPGKDFIPVEWVDACEKYGKWKIVKVEQPEVDFEKEWDEFEDWMESYITSDYPTYYAPKDIARHFYELGRQSKPEVFDTVAFQKGVQEGRRLEREDVKSIIQSRIDEILGDAQPAPILRMELQELIKKIEA